MRRYHLPFPRSFHPDIGKTAVVLVRLCFRVAFSWQAPIRSVFDRDDEIPGQQRRKIVDIALRFGPLQFQVPDGV